MSGDQLVSIGTSCQWSIFALLHTYESVNVVRKSTNAAWEESSVCRGRKGKRMRKKKFHPRHLHISSAFLRILIHLFVSFLLFLISFSSSFFPQSSSHLHFFLFFFRSRPRTYSFSCLLNCFPPFPSSILFITFLLSPHHTLITSQGTQDTFNSIIV